MFESLSKWKPIQSMRGTLVPSHQLGELKFPLLDDLLVQRTAQPRDTFWRVVDMVVTTFGTLQVIPPDLRASYREYATDAYKRALTHILNCGENLTPDTRKNIEDVMNTLDDIKTHADSDRDLEREVNVLRSIIFTRRKEFQTKEGDRQQCQHQTSDSGSVISINDSNL